MRTAWSIAASVVVLMMGQVAPDAAVPSITGDWGRLDGSLHINIAPCGDQLCAVSTWTRDSQTGDRVGDRLILSLRERAGAMLAGRAFDERRQLTYSLQISVDGNAMTTRGCLMAGMACRTMNWTRLSSPS